MNMKSTLSYFIAAVTALSLSACSDDNETEGQGGIEVPQQELTFNSNVNESSISIKTTGTWTASSDINWCKPHRVAKAPQTFRYGSARTSQTRPEAAKSQLEQTARQRQSP